MLLLSSAATAQTAGEARQVEAEPGEQCPPLPEASLSGEARSELLFQRFRCLFDRGQYQACLPVLDEACTLTDAPRCLYSKAVVHQALFQCELAVRYYAAYLSRDPYDTVRDEAVAALTELRGICGEPDPGPRELPAAHDAIPPLAESTGTAAAARASFSAEPALAERQGGASQARELVAFSTLGAGVATAIATAVFASYGEQAESDITARARQNGNVRDRETRALEDSGRRYNTLAWIFLGGSVALLGTSATLFVLDAQAEEAVSVSAEGGLSVRYRTRF